MVNVVEQVVNVDPDSAVRGAEPFSTLSRYRRGQGRGQVLFGSLWSVAARTEKAEARVGGGTRHVLQVGARVRLTATGSAD